MKQYYSEYGEDKWIDENLVMLGGGRYLDIGAAHPSRGSNTAFLRDKDWEGISVDADPIWQQFWRPGKLLTAIVSPHPKVGFDFNPTDPQLSRVDYAKKHKDAIPIMQLCSPIMPDFISIDVEGHECDVMSGIDYMAHGPRVIVAEYNTKGIGEDFRLRDLLLSNGYRVVHQTVANLIYVR